MKVKIQFSKDEIIIFISSLIIFSFLGFLFLQKFPEYQMYQISGYDPYVTDLIKAPMEHVIKHLRHPLLILYLLPFSLLYGLLNSDVFIMMIFSSMASFAYLFSYKIAHEVVGIVKTEALLLTSLLFSFAQILIISIHPESFPFSFFLLTISLYLIGRNFEKTIPFKTYLILFFLTSGVTLTNGIKILISILFEKYSFKKKLIWIIGILLAFLIVMTPVYFFSGKIEQERSNNKTEEAFLKESAELNPVINASKLPGFLVPINFNVPFLPSLIENFIGESLLFHKTDFGKDITHGRPVLLKYESSLNYIVTISLFLVFILGFILNRKNNFVIYLFCFWLVDIFIHIICRFGFDELYIYSSHWLMLMPIIFAFLLKKTERWKHHALLAYFTVIFIYIGYNNLLV